MHMNDVTAEIDDVPEYRVILSRGSTKGVSVSIIMPVFNAAGRQLAERLRDLACSSNPSTEIVIVDDGSSDTTLNQVVSGVAEIETVTVLASRRNGGVARARNAAIERLRGEFAWFIDWDDEWQGDAARRLLSVARESRADIVICRALVKEIDGSSRVVDGIADSLELDSREAFVRFLDGELFGYLWTKLIRVSLLGEAPFPAIAFQSDLGGLIPVISRAHRIATIADILYTHVARPGSVSRSASTDVSCKFACRDVVLREVARLGNSIDLQRRARKWIFRRVYLGSVNTAIRLGQSNRSVVAIVDRVAESVRWGEIARHATVGPVDALNLALVKLLRRRYISVVELWKMIRSRA